MEVHATASQLEQHFKQSEARDLNQLHDTLHPVLEYIETLQEPKGPPQTETIPRDELEKPDFKELYQALKNHAFEAETILENLIMTNQTTDIGTDLEKLLLPLESFQFEEAISLLEKLANKYQSPLEDQPS